MGPVSFDSSLVIYLARSVENERTHWMDSADSRGFEKRLLQTFFAKNATTQRKSDLGSIFTSTAHVAYMLCLFLSGLLRRIKITETKTFQTGQNVTCFDPMQFASLVESTTTLSWQSCREKSILPQLWSLIFSGAGSAFKRSVPWSVFCAESTG